MKIAYEPHPVSAARKAELMADGFKIIDARFEPKAEVTAMMDTAKMKRADLVDLLEMHGGETTGNVAELRARLNSIIYMGDI